MKRLLNITLCLIALGGGVNFAAKSEEGKSQPIPFRLAEETVRLESFEEQHFEWKRSGKGDEPVYLSFEARIDGRGFRSGGAYALKLFVNKMPVTVDRMVNKQFHWIHGKRSVNAWGGPNETLGLLYHPWGNETPQLGRLHRYVFDITKLLDGEGKADIGFLSVFAAIEGAAVELRKVEMLVGGEVERHPHPVVDEPLYLSAPLQPFRQKALSLHRGVTVALDESADYDPAASVALNTRAPLPPTPVPMKGEESGMTINAPAFPASLGLRIGHKGSEGWKQVRLSAKAAEGEAGSATWEWTDGTLRLERRIVATAFGTEVFDKLFNLTEKDKAVGVLYEVGLTEGVESLREFRLFGRKRGVFFSNSVPTRESATIPAVYFRNKGGASLGLLVEDDVLRNQASWLAWDSTLAFGTDLFYLPARGNYEFHLSTSSAADYFTFLNKTRAKWEAFQTIPGLFGFVYPFKQDKALQSPTQWAAFLEETGITIPCVVPSLDYETDAPKMLYGNERPASVEKAAEGIAAFAETLRQANPQAQLLFYTDMHLVRTDGEKAMLEELADSVIENSRGQPVEYREGWLYNLLPSEKTSAGKRFMQNLATYLDVPRIKGVFLDEWDHSRAIWSFSHADGFSAQVDDGFRIKRRIGKVPLLTQTYQKQISDLLAGKESIVYANQFDSTKLATALPIVHFAEPTQADSYFLYGAQLGRTPLSLTIKRSTSPWSDVQEFLKKGVLTCFYARRLTGDHLLRHLYPFTAERLGPGYVIGRERLVTLVDGTYTFGEERPIRARIFGGEGGRFLREERAEKSESGGPITLKLKLDREAQEVAIIEAL